MGKANPTQCGIDAQPAQPTHPAHPAHPADAAPLVDPPPAP
jgi:hypothetical protein